MKAISVRQPWAWAILHAGKDVENRTWASRFTGRVLIHAAKQPDFDPAKEREWAKFFHKLGFNWTREPRGAIIGVVTITGCIPAEASASWWSNDSGFCFLLEDPQPFAEPIPWKGALGFFDVPDDVVREAMEAIAPSEVRL